MILLLQVALPSHSVEVSTVVSNAAYLHPLFLQLMAITPTFILPPPGLSKPAAVVPVGMVQFIM